MFDQLIKHMTIKAISVEDYIQQVSDDKREAIIALRKVIKNNIPKDFEIYQL